MYNTISKSITNKLVSKSLISEDKKEVYTYGFEILISTAVYALIFVLCAILTSTFITSILFFFGFYFVRKFCGGMHADSYLKCHLMSAFNHLLVIAILLTFPEAYQLLFTVVSLGICSVMIFLFAPVDHKNKRFIKTEYQSFKKKSVLYGCIVLNVLLLTVICNLFHMNINIYVFAYSLGTLSATISMLGAKIINSNERRKVI